MPISTIRCRRRPCSRASSPSRTLNRSIASINPTGAVDSGAAGGADYPLSNAWHERLASDNFAAGLTAHQSWNRISLDVNYVYTHGDSAIGYSFASTGAFFNLLTAAQAGSAFPDIVFDSHTLQANARYQASKALSYVLLYRFDFEHLDDFHYNGLVARHQRQHLSGCRAGKLYGTDGRVVGPVHILGRAVIDPAPDAKPFKAPSARRAQGCGKRLVQARAIRHLPSPA